MNRFTVLFCAVIFAMVLAVSASPASAEQQGDQTLSALVKGNRAFAVRLYNELGATRGNLFFSPFSISSALGMAFAGARENTAAEMKTAMSFELDQTLLHDAFRQLNQNLSAAANQHGQKLNIANGLCLTGGDVSEEFKSLLQKNYAAELFAGGLEKINDWVKTKTEGKIEKILEMLDPDSVCVLLNAIYFKGTWESQFDKKLTNEADFSVTEKEKVKVPFMYQKSSFKIIEKGDFQAISLPYKGNLMSMVVVLPQSTEGLAGLEKDLNIGKLDDWMSEIDSAPAQNTELYLPKFKFATGYDLVPACTALGMKDAFDKSGAADFSGMGWPKGRLWISQIKHKAFVEVNEEGTEAAAATAVEMATKSISMDPVFRADHPFIFIIRENATGSILFMGRMVDPGSK
ncbi:MAG TPA: serpin family protein [Candidatus Rifleibacterium sp.]|nr:serpin family protein [Candidatus Rifleibacterium sp.]HPT45395.1 serpin family protein [Candidatus Rifleibacterium sp.]